MKYLVTLVVLVGCSGDVAPIDQLPPDASAGSMGHMHVIDLKTCTVERWFEWLPLGSAWVETRPVDLTHCELLLGGETENPVYDGRATQMCIFDRAGAVTIIVGDGGPAYLDDPHCTAT